VHIGADRPGSFGSFLADFYFGEISKIGFLC